MDFKTLREAALTHFECKNEEAMLVLVTWQEWLQFCMKQVNKSEKIADAAEKVAYKTSLDNVKYIGQQTEIITLLTEINDANADNKAAGEPLTLESFRPQAKRLLAVLEKNKY